MDAEKSTVTLVGDVDVVLVVKARRKAKRPVAVVNPTRRRRRRRRRISRRKANLYVHVAALAILWLCGEEEYEGNWFVSQYGLQFQELMLTTTLTRHHHLIMPFSMPLSFY
ncbi:hypothetical protein C4D60_Mb11t10060 [Musa balbisiana]|uniref:Uncharacterized protein n=1 Tax=Musa balbisiana TaxID=52838 RepID=A0A4S8J322_MUSBA|nr:hypothetical protein C4D60_Mb11t10060 [Musa balbisiana]